jgi:hypothetical protein
MENIIHLFLARLGQNVELTSQSTSRVKHKATSPSGDRVKAELTS